MTLTGVYHAQRLPAARCAEEVGVDVSRLAWTAESLEGHQAFQEQHTEFTEKRQAEWRAQSARNGPGRRSRESRNYRHRAIEMRLRRLLITPEASCRRCGAREALQVSHKLALSLGGTDNLANLEVLCAACHRVYDHQVNMRTPFRR
jgi:5-methylcytosine-specific restriction endonuclease McrA